MTRLANISLSFKSMKRDELPRIMELEKICFPDPWPKSSFEEMLDDPKWYMLTASHNAEIIGYAAWMLAAEESHLANIAVLPEYRRKSVAKQLLARIFRHTIGKGCDRILLEVRESNTEALSFYEGFDFKELYRRERYYHNPQESAIVMQLMLESASPKKK